MTSDWLSLLSDTALQQRSGLSVFGRGQTYAASGAIKILKNVAPAPGEQAVLAAEVHGTQVYRVRVCINDKNKLKGACNCPHAQEGNFCKHLVALCLTWRGELGGEAPAHDEAAARKVAAAAKRARTQAENRATLRRFVQSQSAEALAERLWNWAENDRDLMAYLKAWQTEHHAGNDPKTMRSAVSEILRPPGKFLEWDDMPAYINRASRVLPMLAPWLHRDPAALIDLCEHALRCLYKVVENADDSNGEIGGMTEDLVDLLIKALQVAPPPAAWLDRWFKLMKEDPWGSWDEQAILAAAGTAVQGRYAERAQADWKQWQRSHSSTGRFDYERGELRHRYLDSIRMLNDPRALYEAMADSVHEVGEFCDLVALCEEQGWHREAIQWARAAYQKHPDSRLVQDNLLRCCERDGWDEEALAIWRRRLENSPSPNIYHGTLRAAVAAGRDRSAYRAELFAWAEQRETETLAKRRKNAYRWPGEPVRDVGTRLSWLLADNELDAGLALVCQSEVTCHHDLLEALARRLPERQHAEAVTLLRKVFDHEMKTASSPYAKPLELVREILERVAPTEGEAWLADLRTRYKPKRNFIAGLPNTP